MNLHRKHATAPAAQTPDGFLECMNLHREHATAPAVQTPDGLKSIR